MSNNTEIAYMFKIHGYMAILAENTEIMKLISLKDIFMSLLNQYELPNRISTSTSFLCLRRLTKLVYTKTYGHSFYYNARNRKTHFCGYSK